MIFIEDRRYQKRYCYFRVLNFCFLELEGVRTSFVLYCLSGPLPRLDIWACVLYFLSHDRMGQRLTVASSKSPGSNDLCFFTS